MAITTEDDARFVAEKIRDGTLTGERKERAFAMLEEYRAANPLQPDRTVAQKLGRGVGLAARDVAEGVAGIAGIVTDPIGAGVNVVSEALGGPQLSSQSLRADTSAALTRAGLPQPETDAESAVSRINQVVTGGGGFIGLGRSLAANAPGIARSVGQTLASQPALQGASAASSGAAMELVPEDANPLLKAGAGIAGALAPSAVTAGIPALTRGVLRGGETGRQAVADTVDDFSRAGTTPSVGQATQNRAAQAAESALAKVPGGAGVIARKAEQLSDDIAAQVQKIADDLAPKATSERAGMAIERGVVRFADEFRDRAQRLYTAVDDAVAPGTKVGADNTAKALSKTTAPIEGAENTSQALASKFLDDLRQALDDDIAASPDGKLPYEALANLRTRIGERIGNFTLTADVSKGQLKQLYAALSDDLFEAAKAAGPEAVRAANRANTFYKAGISRIENLERVVTRNGGPEKIFQAAIAGTKEGATTLRTVMKSLNDVERRTLTAAVVRRLGTANPSQQDASGTAFSIQTYLTNISKLSPEARSTLFGRQPKDFQKNIDALTNVAANIRAGSQVFSNPSGTAQALALNTAGTLGGAAAIFGRLDAAAGLAGLVGGANLTARLMTNPRFVRWLAKATEAPTGALPAQVNALANMAKNDRDIALAVGLLKQDGENEGN